MTVNAVASYLGFALLIPAALFFVLGLARGRSRRSAGMLREAEALKSHTRSRMPEERADLVCGAVVLALTLALETSSFIGGGPAAGEVTGNTAGGALLIVLLALCCLIPVLLGRHVLINHWRRQVDS
jgi:hypothetical protein